MTILLRGAAGLVLAFALAAPAVAAPSAEAFFGVFQDLCIDTGGGADAMVAKLKDEHWSEPTASDPPTDSNSGSWTRTMDQSDYRFAYGSGMMDLVGSSLAGCAVNATPGPDLDAIKARVRAWVGLDPAADQGATLFVYAERDGKRTPLSLADNAAVKAAAADGTLRIVLVGVDHGTVNLGELRPPSAQP
jgi:hypothetical protein